MTLMLDNVFGVFNNMPPRFNWAEFDLAFPSDDRYFKIANFEELSATGLFPVGTMKIEDAFLILFLPPETSKEKLKVLRDGRLRALDMQLLIHCMSRASSAFLSFSPRTNIPPSHLYPPLDPHLWQSTHLPTDNRCKYSSHIFQNSTVGLENHLERNKILNSGL